LLLDYWLQFPLFCKEAVDRAVARAPSLKKKCLEVGAGLKPIRWQTPLGKFLAVDPQLFSQ